VFVGKVGAGPFAGLTIAANIPMSLAIDHYGLFGMQPHSMNSGRAIGALSMTGVIVLITKY
jgi:transporter family-2 protein